MPARRFRFDHLVAAVEVACGVAVAVLLWTPGAVLPTLLGVAVGAGLIAVAVRRWRRADRAAEREPARAAPVAPARPAPLSADGERELARVVAVLADAGVFAPRVPDAADLRAPVADQGEPVTLDAVLAALDEVPYRVPGADPAAYGANLAFHASDGVQSVDELLGHVADLVRLAGGGLADVSATVELVPLPGSARVRTRVRLVVDGTPRELTYPGTAADLCTVLHVELARILRARRTGRRVAWFWGDQGVWLTGLRDGALEPLNAALGPAAGAGWEWVDEDVPTDADDLYVH